MNPREITLSGILSITRVFPWPSPCRCITCSSANRRGKSESNSSGGRSRLSASTVSTIRLMSESSPAPNTWEWVAAICSTRLVPDRRMPTMKTGASDGFPLPSTVE